MRGEGSSSESLSGGSDVIDSFYSNSEGGYQSHSGSDVYPYSGNVSSDISNSEGESGSEGEADGGRNAASFEQEVEDVEGLPDEQICVICLSAKRTVGYLHRGTVHVSVCKRCSERTVANSMRSVKCPICMQSSQIVTVFS